jgi:hypothetical protein
MAGAAFYLSRQQTPRQGGGRDRGAGRTARRHAARQLGDRDGQLKSLQDWPDQALIVNFWATWCAPAGAIPLLRNCSDHGRGFR